MLASRSESRRAMLTAAGVEHEAVSPGVDEDAAKASLRHLSPRDLADALAELKALKVSGRMPGRLVLGGDSLVALADGTLLDKPETREIAAEHLARLSGGSHDLYSAAVLAEDGRPVWRVVARARLHVRRLSDSFIDWYLDCEWPAIAGCVGCFRLEAIGPQLFTRVEGDAFTVLGLPLFPVLDALRLRGLVPT